MKLNYQYFKEQFDFRLAGKWLVYGSVIGIVSGLAAILFQTLLSLVSNLTFEHWVKILVPGAGWIGVDPSAGIFTTEAYIPTAACYLPRATLTVSGNYRGSVNSQLETKVNIVQETSG